MGLFDKLKQCFSKEVPEPVASWSHPSFGEFVWNAEAEAWVGAYGACGMSFGFENASEPNAECVDFAIRLFSDQTLFNSSLIQAKSEAKASMASHLGDEIESLSVQAIHFCLCPEGEALVVEFAGGQHGREWTADFVGLDCQGLSYGG